MSIDLGYYAVDAEVENKLRAAADVLRDGGAAVEEVELGLTREVNDIGYKHWFVYAAAFIGPYVEQWGEVLDPYILMTVEEGRKMDAVTLKQLEFDRTRQWLKFCPLFEHFDALLCPTASMPALSVGTSDLDFGHDDARGRYHHYEMTFPFNLFSACPALSMPSGFSSSGLPTAVQIVGRPHDGPTVLAIGAGLEGATPWLKRRPPI